MRRIYRMLMVAVVAGILCVGCRSRDPENVSRAASALMGQSESVFYAGSGFLAGTNSSGALPEKPAENLRFPFVYLDLALAGVQDHFYSDVLRSSNGVMLGAKEFRAPQGSLGLGAVTAQRCFVIMLGADSRFDLRQYFHASPAATLSNGPVWQWAVHIDEFDPGHIGTMPEGKPRLSQLFATQVGHDYVVVANNLEDLQEVVNKLASSGASYGNLTAMHGWETIRRHEVWGYRRYRHTEATDTLAAGMADVAPGTEAFACFLDLRKKTLTAQLIPGPVDGARAAERLNARNAFPPLMRSEKGIWETSITFSNDEKSDEAAWDVVGLFGFIVYS